MRNVELNKVRPVLAAAEAGHMTIPVEATNAQTAIANLQAVNIKIPDEAAARQQLVDATLVAATHGKPLPSPVAWLKAKAAVTEAELHRQLVADAVDVAEGQLLSALTSDPDRIITEHAAPALAEVLDQAKAAATDAEGDGSRDSLLHGTTASNAAWRQLEQLAAQYASLREVQRVLASNATEDVMGLFYEFKQGLRSFWPTAGTSFSGPPPWPEQPAARLRWLVTSGHDIWLPTAAQRDTAWLAAYATKTQQAQAQQVAS